MADHLDHDRLQMHDNVGILFERIQQRFNCVQQSHRSDGLLVGALFRIEHLTECGGQMLAHVDRNRNQLLGECAHNLLHHTGQLIVFGFADDGQHLHRNRLDVGLQIFRCVLLRRKIALDHNGRLYFDRQLFVVQQRIRCEPQHFDHHLLILEVHIGEIVQHPTGASSHVSVRTVELWEHIGREHLFHLVAVFLLLQQNVGQRANHVESAIFLIRIGIWIDNDLQLKMG